MFLGFKNIVNIVRIFVVGAGAIFLYRKLQQQQGERPGAPNRSDGPATPAP